MQGKALYRLNTPTQIAVSIAAVLSVAAVCYFFEPFTGYRAVAMLLLVTVSLLAMFFSLVPVFIAATLSALVWNFFFIPPRFTFHVDKTEDVLMLAMYFVIALVNAALTFKIRQNEKVEMQQEQKENTLKLYNTLLNSLSHELRTPIATIIGATDNLLSKEVKLSDENKEELVGEISKASLRLNRQVENLLNMSRLESGSVNLKLDWVDVNELVYDVLGRLKDVLHHHPVNVKIKDSLPLYKLDYGLMEQVLYNLVYNAAMYIPKYCVITIRATSVEDNLVLTVEDNGNGFPEAEIGKVFDKFYRLQNSKTGGTGLGLSIVRGFIEAHHGKIVLENVSTGGARFTIAIPAEASYLNMLKNE